MRDDEVPLVSDGDELARRRSQPPRRRVPSSAIHPSDSPEADRAAAAEDRRRAADDRRRAEEYLAAAYRDEITGVLNRRPGREQLEVELARCRRTSTSLALLFFDVDGLKRINDAAGHLVGDQLLAATGAALRASLRGYDVVLRYGGDEFICAMPGGNTEIAEETVDRVRRALDTRMPGATLSAGIAELRPEDALDQLIHRADEDLYRRRAGSAGRIRPASAPDPPGAWPRTVTCPDCGRTIVVEPAPDDEAQPPRG